MVLIIDYCPGKGVKNCDWGSWRPRSYKLWQAVNSQTSHTEPVTYRSTKVFYLIFIESLSKRMIYTSIYCHQIEQCNISSLALATDKGKSIFSKTWIIFVCKHNGGHFVEFISFYRPVINTKNKTSYSVEAILEQHLLFLTPQGVIIIPVTVCPFLMHHKSQPNISTIILKSDSIHKRSRILRTKA